MKKSLKAVFSPQKFSPSLMARPGDYAELWETNRRWVLSNMAHIAYFKEPEIRAFSEELGASRTHFYDIDGAQAFLSLWPSKAILSFRGSQPREDDGTEMPKPGFFSKLRFKISRKLQLDPQFHGLLSNDVHADLQLGKVPFDNTETVEVHKGFLKEINKIWDKISFDIEPHTEIIPIWVTGHSLGAAMATLAGMRLPFEDVVTFGEPRVGTHIDRAFKAKNHTRYVNGADPVTKVPPKRIFGYEHHGNLESISDSDGRTDPRYDHSIVYYSENLAQPHGQQRIENRDQ